MATLLIRSTHIVDTRDDHRRETAGGGLFVQNGFISHFGPTTELLQNADEVLI